MQASKAGETWGRVARIIQETPVVDAHTHIQDDIGDFTPAMAEANLAGTQASINRPSRDVIAQAVSAGRLYRRSMLDPTHALFYSFANALAIVLCSLANFLVSEGWVFDA